VSLKESYKTTGVYVVTHEVCVCSDKKQKTREKIVNWKETFLDV